MIHYVFRTVGSARLQEGVADRVKLIYTANETKIAILEGDRETVWLLSNDWNLDAISEFRCDKFTVHAHDH